MQERYVQIRRKESEVQLLPVVARNQANVYLSSVFKGASPHRGLTPDEEEEFLAPHLGVVRGTSPDYGKKIADFYKDISLNIPVSGMVLNISTISGKPVNVYEWILWKWASSHPLVSPNKAEMDRDVTKRFFIYDPEEAERDEAVVTQQKIQAYGELAKLVADKEDDAAVDRILLMYDMDHRGMSRNAKETLLTSKVDENPGKFLGILSDKYLKLKSKVVDMIRLQVLHRQSTAIMYVDTVLGHSLQEAALWFTNPDNSELVGVIKGRYQSARRDASGLSPAEAASATPEQIEQASAVFEEV